MGSSRAWMVPVAGGLSVMVALGFGRFGYTMLLSPTREGLHLSYTDAGLLGTMNFTGYLLGSLVSGITVQFIGANLVGWLSILGVALSLSWVGLASGLLDAGLARACCGAFSAIAYVQCLGVVVAWSSAKSRGLASGLIHSGNGCAMILCGIGLPWIIERAHSAGWRVGWGVLGAIGIAIVPVVRAYLRYPASLEFGNGPALKNPPRRISNSAYITKLGALYSLFGFSYVIYVTFFVELVHAGGMSLTGAGMIWASVGLLSLGSGPWAGALSDRIGRISGLALMFGLQGLAYALMLIGSSWSSLLSAVVFGTTVWGFPSIIGAIASDRYSADDVMHAFGRMTAIMGIGQAAGPLAAGALADLSGNVSSGLYLAIATAGTGCLCAVFVEFDPKRRRTIEAE